MLMPLSAVIPPKARVIWSAVRIGSPIRLTISSLFLGEEVLQAPRSLRRRDRELGAHIALAAVLEGDFGLDAARRAVRIKRIDQRLVAGGDDPAAHLARTGELAIIGVELFVQDQKAADLRAGDGWLGGEVIIYLLDADLQQIVDRILSGEILIRGVGEVAPLRPVADRLEVEVEKRDDKRPAVAEHHRFLDPG